MVRWLAERGLRAGSFATAYGDDAAEAAREVAAAATGDDVVQAAR
jgi:hypothetical protein